MIKCSPDAWIDSFSMEKSHCYVVIKDGSNTETRNSLLFAIYFFILFKSLLESGGFYVAMVY